MQNPKSSLTKSVVLSASYTSHNPHESFPDTSNGNLTWHTLISAPKTPTQNLSAGIAVCLPATGHLCAHRHVQAELYYILHGVGQVTIDGTVYPVSAGSIVYIPPDAEHAIVNTGSEDLRWFYVFPTSSFADVVYRFSEKRAKL
ncbi:RmlC-like cupin domain-containing protein [Penicillium lagena]|uniref:RmlC-like cupin domain-containing protein n=1 Tax=Penicillium lagena TaxID=94218 RepID=UPI002540C94A|nr:RmlC-like cupin domain-containing protein [Penicillium lagena]KAJ5625586.1 RmlC-like cupin domain-containing protein [Penicillium lagena]